MASHDFPVAIIGMAIKLPCAKNCEEFWDMMVNRTDTVSSFPSGRASDVAHVLETFKDQLVAETNPFCAGSYFKQVDKFDAEMFQIDPEEAVFIEPEQRIFLQTVWELLEDAGYASKIQESNTGVYVSNTTSKYKHILAENHQDISHGKQPPSISSRISFTYNLHGPTVTVDTQCSSSLFSIHLACKGLSAGDCDMAIAGGIALDLLPIRTKTNFWNPENIDHEVSDETEGCGILLLKPLEKAMAENDNIYAVLEATVANQDDHLQGMTSNHARIQADLLNDAWNLAKISPECLGYIGVHEIGTTDVNAVEIHSIMNAFDKVLTKDLASTMKIPIDYTKANTGYLADGGTGILALIKCILCMKHSKIPPTRNTYLNSYTNWSRAAMFVNTSDRKWESPDNGLVRYGSVSAVNFLGTSVHAVVREVQMRHSTSNEQTEHVQLLCIAARSNVALKMFVKSLLAYFTKCGDKTYADFSSVCFTLNSGRELRKFKVRSSLIAGSWSQMKSTLESLVMMIESGENDKECWLMAEPTFGNDKTTIMNCLENKQRITLHRFFKGEQINWVEYYESTPAAKKRIIGQIPTYCFQTTRYWPTVLSPRSHQNLILEHQIPKLNCKQLQLIKESTDLSSIQDTLAMIVKEVLGIRSQNDILQQSDLLALGINSLMFNHLVNTIKEIYKVNISVRELTAGMNIHFLADLIHQQMQFEEYPSSKTIGAKLNGKCLEIKKLQNIWMTVLELETCPRDKETFVECGGNSFKAVVLQSFTKEQFGLQLRVVDILKNPTFSEFCSMVAAAFETKPKQNSIHGNQFENIPLSQAQKRMIVLQTAIPDSTAYTETIAMQAQQKVDLQYLSQALAAQHPILTAQIDPDSMTLTCTHAMHCVASVCEFETMEEVEMHLSASKPCFQLISGALSQIRLIVCRNPKRWLVVVDVHHIVVDDRTLHNIKLSLLNILQTKDALDMSTTVHKVQKTPIISFDEQTYLNSKDAVDDEIFWQSCFEMCPSTATLSLESYTNKSDFIAHPAEFMTSKLSADQIGKIQKYCRNIKVTEFQYFLACVTLTVQRYLGTNEVTIAVPVSTRDTDTQTADGLFVNTVLFKYNIRKDVTFHDFVLDVVKVWLKCLSHARFPLDRIGEIVWERHGVSINSFCNILFNFATFSPLENEMKVKAKHSKMQLSIDIVPTVENRYEVVSEYSRDEMDHDIVSRFNETLKHTFEICIDAQHKLIKNTEYLCKKEIDLIASMNKNDFKIDNAESVLEKFLQHAADHPHAIAVRCNEKDTSYYTLYCMALKVKAALKTFDIKVLQKLPVALYMDKSEKTIAAIFGIWLAGGHFLPISTLHSTQLHDVIKTTSPCAIVLDTEDKATCKLENSEVLQMSEILKYHNHKQDIQSKKISHLSDTAYIIKSSGSTGAPKRIMINHESLAIIADAWNKVYDMTSYKVNVLQWAPLSFDVFIGDVVRALCCAPGTLCICSDEKRLDVEYIRDVIHKSKISIAEVTPQFGIHLVENGTREQLASLKVFILGSDMLQKEVYSRVKSCLHDGQRLFNSYGMSEATIDSACFEGNLICTRSGTIPVGKPLPGVKLHVFEPGSLRPCPIGTVGELFIGGRVIGKGDTEVVSSESGDILLKTNDKACWLPSGDLELLGRFDDTCKLRGFRINTAEIENTILRQCNGIKDAVVDIKENISGATSAKFLCAFVALKNPNAPHGIEKLVQTKIKEIHPYYMIPDTVQVLDHIPLTSNGKIDKRALPSIVKISGSGSTRNVNLSSTATLLQTLFAEALGLASESHFIDVEQTFMEQGGHSLVLVQFHSLIKQRTQLDVTIADIFTYPSILSLSGYTTGEGRAFTDDEDYIGTKVLSNQNGLCLDIAITGVGVRMPGEITSFSDLWEFMQQGKDLIGDFPASRKVDILSCSPATFVRELTTCDEFRGAFLSSIDKFDNCFFGISPEEANVMSPEQRLFLEVATEALSEGTNIFTIKGKRVGVFIANAEVAYANLHHSDDTAEIAGMMNGMIATRVAYQYNLKGPTMLVDTACSSSLVALKTACESIRRGECISALVGGINLVTYPARRGIYGAKTAISSDCHCRAFDQDADGMAVGEGVICYYIESLENAVQQNKRIYGVVKSVAANNVGRGNGLTAPTAKSQEQVIKQALQYANMKASDISFVETHGTGTKLGDKIELSGLTSVFNANTISKVCHIGSVKTMFGHLSNAGGMIGLLKVLAAFTFQKIPPTLNLKNPHPELKNSSLKVPSKTENWETNGEVRTAGLSSFGLTSTNCHAILTEAPSRTMSCEPQQDQVNSTPLLFSSANFDHLKTQAALYYTLISQTVGKHKINTLGEICQTVATQLKNLKDAKLGYHQVKMVVMAKDITQVLSTLRLIGEAENFDTLQKLASARSGVHTCKTMLNTEHAIAVDDKQREGISIFLQSGDINCEALFQRAERSEVTAIGVKVAMFVSKRHWLKANCRNSSENIGLIDLMYDKISKTRELMRNIPLAPTQDLIKMQGKFCSSIILTLFRDTDLAHTINSSEVIEFHKAFKLTNIMKKYDKLFFVMIRELWDNGFVLATGRDSFMCNLDTFSFINTDKHLQDPETIAEEAVVRYPAWADCFRFPLHGSQCLKDVLQGNKSPLVLIHPKGDINFRNQHANLGDLLGEVYYNMYMQLIVEYAAQLSRIGQKVRILEIGAGMGQAAKQLLPNLVDIPNIEYWFTDFHRTFVENAKKSFEKYQHMMKFSTFNISKDASKHALLDSYDIIISHNTIHATESVIDSVVNLKSCLGDDGALFVIENTRNETWASLTWGIFDGWWNFKDYEIRPFEPMLKPDKWEAVLRKAGFGSVYSCPQDPEERKHVNTFLFVCSVKECSAQSQYVPDAKWWNVVDYTERNASFIMDNVSATTSYRVLDEDGRPSAYLVKSELKRLWCELLDTQDIQEDDDFSSLGGNSQLTLHMIAMIRQRIGCQIDIDDIFCHLSLGSLCDFIVNQLNSTIRHSGALRCNSVAEEAQLEYGTYSNGPQHKRTMLMFPGQGAERMSMCLSMANSEPAKSVFKAAEKIAGYNVLDICMKQEDLEQRMKSTEFAHVSLLVGCIAKVEQIKAENPERLASITHVAGLSVGEYAALVYAGVLTLEEAVEIAQQRGRAIDQQAKRAASAMASVLGPTCSQLQRFLRNHFPYMQIAIYLADNQHTVAGTEANIDKLVKVLSSEQKWGMSIVDVRRLRVAGAFHSSFMEEVAQIVNPIIESCQFRKPQLPVILNATGKVSKDPEVIKVAVMRKLTESVMWKQTIATAYDLGVRNFIEVAPVQILSSIVKSRIRHCKGCSTELIVV